MLSAIEELKELISSLPGIGPKSALKLALFLIELPAGEKQRLFENLGKAVDRVFHCSLCHAYAEKDPCPRCQTPYSEEGVLCVVETAAEIFALEAHLPKGSRFHVLGGKLSPLNGVSPKDLTLDLLMKRVSTEEGVKEVLLAMGPDVEGEATASYVQAMLKDCGRKISRMAFGVSVGSSLLSSDERSIQKSIAARISY